MEKSFIASLFDSCLTAIINYLITESEVITGKSQTEASPYRPSNEVNMVGRGLRFSCNFCEGY